MANETQEIYAMPDECVVEMKKSQPTHTLLAAEFQPDIGELLNCGDYSTLSHLLRVTAYVIRAVRIFKKSYAPPPDRLSVLTPEELSEADRLWIIHAQKALTGDKQEFFYLATAV